MESLDRWLFLCWLNDKFLPLLPARTRLTYKVPKQDKMGLTRVPANMKCDADQCVRVMVIRSLNVVTPVLAFGSDLFWVAAPAAVCPLTWHHRALPSCPRPPEGCSRHDRAVLWNGICGPSETSQKLREDVTTSLWPRRLIFCVWLLFAKRFTTNRFVRSDSNSWRWYEGRKKGRTFVSVCSSPLHVFLWRPWARHPEFSCFREPEAGGNVWSTQINGGSTMGKRFTLRKTKISEQSTEDIKLYGSPQETLLK